ncbi:ferric iron uptake transcriptional regulator [Azohydromonas aeria]|uniref:ferric iron uptake transcriptional regulator n=1 Tax=Azohydromonas aeria TaxID=2590212 RepID=UPI0012FB065C|nr:ferric iron uptake transcriptional regulator [Azohydromonas aeria]
MSKQPPAPGEVDDLRGSGLKATLPRMRVLDVFKQSSARHLSAEDVYRELMGAGADIGLATVYRVLMQFEQAGLLSRSNFDNGKSVFELRQGSHHDHLVCVRCGRVEEFHDAAIEDRQRAVAEAMGFELREHALTLYGLCSAATCGGAEAAGKH